MDDVYYETIITKLCEIVSIMDTKEVLAEIGENPELQDLYYTIHDITNRFEELQRIAKNPRYIPHTNPSYIIDTQTDTFLKVQEVCERLNKYENIIFKEE